MNISIELNNSQKYDYENIDRIDDSDKYKITLYRDDTLVAIINRGDIKNLFTAPAKKN